MTVEGLMTEWESFKDNPKIIVEISGKLRFDYLAIRNLIIQALIFWKFVKTNLSEKSWQLRRDFLKGFVSDQNYIGIVAMIESMPDSLWRKILWKYNLDFASSEAFLRRLANSQMEAIVRNWRQLFEENEIPEAFSWYDRHVKKVTVEKLLAEPIDKEWRYKSKGAMAYNFMKLGFGFNMYHGGLADDTKTEAETIGELIKSVKWFFRKKREMWEIMQGFESRFEDFVVQWGKDGGRYWWFYRTAHSDYVFNPGKEVKLNTHFCPGFWYTLIMQSLFWIVSPLGFAAGLVWLVQDPAGYKLIPILLFSLTPTWLMAAAGKFSALNLILPAAKYIKEKEIVKKYKIFEILFSLIALLLVTASLASVKIALEYIIKTLGPHWVFWSICLEFFFFSIYSVNLEKKKSAKDPDEFILKLLSILTGGIILASLAVHFRTDIVFAFGWLVALIKGIAGVLGGIWFYFGLPLLMILAVFSVIMAPVLLVLKISEKLGEEREELFFNRLEKGIMYFFVAFFIFSLAYVLFEIYLEGGLASISWLIVAFSLIMFGLAFFITSLLNPQKKRYKRIARRFGGRAMKGLSYKLFMANKALAFRSEKDSDAVHALLTIIEKLLPSLGNKGSWNRTRLAQEFIPKLKPGIAEKLHEKIQRYCWSRGGIDYLDYESFRVFLKKLFEGLDCEDALKEAEEISKKINADRATRRQKFEQSLEKVAKFFRFVSTPVILPVILLIKAIGWLWKKIWELVRTLSFFREFYKERCPFITPSRNLFLDE